MVTVDGLMKTLPLLLAGKGKNWLMMGSFVYVTLDYTEEYIGGFQEDMKGYTVSQF
jgi:hypothetical protein